MYVYMCMDPYINIYIYVYIYIHIHAFPNVCIHILSRSVRAKTQHDKACLLPELHNIEQNLIASIIIFDFHKQEIVTVRCENS